MLIQLFEAFDQYERLTAVLWLLFVNRYYFMWCTTNYYYLFGYEFYDNISVWLLKTWWPPLSLYVINKWIIMTVKDSVLVKLVLLFNLFYYGHYSQQDVADDDEVFNISCSLLWICDYLLLCGPKWNSVWEFSVAFEVFKLYWTTWNLWLICLVFDKICLVI